MFTFVVIFIMIACALLVVVILAQNPKGGGLNASFGSIGNQIMGARQSVDFMEKATWYLAIGIIVLSLGSNFFMPTMGGPEDERRSRLEDRVEGMAPQNLNQPPPGTQQQQQQGEGTPPPPPPPAEE
ncbi:MAG: preprotein translocase subunit SecG [Bacteroidia bacterium]